MFQLKLDGQLCISCGICMDVCAPKAIAMRLHRAANAEGSARTYLFLQSSRNAERQPEKMMTFPYLAEPARCNGCAACVRECPVSALELLGAVEHSMAACSAAGST